MKVNKTQSKIRLHNREVLVDTKDIGTCGQRILGPCRETNHLIINFIDTNLQSTLSSWSKQLKDQILDFGGV